MILLILLIIVAYLCGSLTSAIMISRIAHLPDPRQQGSRNPGTTNILRISGKKWASYVLLLDAAKGAIPVLIAKLVGISSAGLLWVCLAAVVGHIYPLFFQFKGGKGVATALGGLLIATPYVALLIIATWLLVAYLWRYSSLAAIISSVLTPLYLVCWGSHAMVLPVLLISACILMKHLPNLRKLRAGTESKISF